MECRLCRFWLRDLSFPNHSGYCSLKGSVTAASFSCELFRKKDEEAIAIQVISY